MHATLTIQAGELRIGDPLATFSATVTVDAARFSSRNANAKKDVRSPGLLDVETHPHVTFASDTLQEMPDGWLVTGIATAHGPTIPVDVRVDRVTHEGAGLRVHGRNEHLDRTALGITGSRAWSVAISTSK